MLDPSGWHLSGRKGSYNLTELEQNEKNYEKYKSETFFKERWINENGLEQKLIVTYSLKYRDYQRKIRNRQLERATRQVEKAPSSLNRKKQNDYKRFITSDSVTKDGEIADKVLHSINADAIQKEEMYDGFYAVCTNLENDTFTILKINHRRWKIEECFRLLKSEFKARPVYLSRDDRIIAHFTTCFLALTIYRYLEKRLDEKLTSHSIINNLREIGRASCRERV